MISLIFISSYLIVIALIPLTLLYLKTITVDGFKDIVLALGSTLGAPLGIVLNNYFKDEVSNK